jgi:iron(III) transport system ATP-binding protein
MATSFPNTSNLTGEVTIAVRPENITLSKDNGTMPGMLTHRFYLGDSVDYRVQVGEEVVRVIVKGADLKQFKDGEKVFLDFEKILVFDKE